MLRESLAMAVLVGWASVTIGEVAFDWAIVGNPGNAEDPLNAGAWSGIGSVRNGFRIARHEVTNDQYAEFLNAVAATGHV